jgi:hypothetical protein
MGASRAAYLRRGLCDQQCSGTVGADCVGLTPAHDGYQLAV